jgi:hypothetical protein
MSRRRLQRAFVALLLAWCVVTALGGLRAALARNEDLRYDLEAQFAALASELPPRGVVGYLEPRAGEGLRSLEMRHVAQYALVPRVLETHTGPEFLILAPGAVLAEADSTLAAYDPVGRELAGHRVYRRSR